MPTRIQLRRTAGWRLPADAIHVARPSRWGNPHPARRPCPICVGVTHDPGDAVAAYRYHLAANHRLLTAARDMLAGLDVACWCPPGQPCHGDVLLVVAAGADPLTAATTTTERTTP